MSRKYLRTEPAEAVTGGVTRSLVARISFDERHVARLGSPVNGRVKEVKVVTGDVVRRGDALATLLAVDVASSQAQLADARTTKLQAEREAERSRLLLTDGAGSEAELQRAESALALARAEELRASAALTAIGGAAGQASYVVRAPISGTVVERRVAVGSQVTDSAEQPLLTVADLGQIWVLADVYEHDLPFVQQGNSVQVRVLAFPERSFTGILNYLSPVIDPGTRSAIARVELVNPDGLLRPGMLAQVEVMGERPAAASVPTSALLTMRDQFFVFVDRGDGAFERREVLVAEQRGQRAVLLSGVASGELVVAEGAILLDAEANEAL